MYGFSILYDKTQIDNDEYHDKHKENYRKYNYKLKFNSPSLCFHIIAYPF